MYYWINREKKTFLLVSLFPQAYEEVQGFLNSSFPTSEFSDLAKALDAKCQAIDKLSALLRDLTVGKSGMNRTILAANVTLQISVCYTNVPYSGYRPNINA